ncbi:GNAT family N-acetyltransferase [Actinomadura sp. 1N219]|uniref:GNAT family N-acetyltransferase n=1 Tax=Actinomadura sp. 1N219 TaxID=3375152 RepID=UPI0037A24CF2
MSSTSLHIRQILLPQQIGADLTRELVECWVAVSNDGGAVGFPFPPVTAADVNPAAHRLISDLDPQLSRLVIGMVDGALAGWLNIRRDPHPLVAHWGTVHHVQSHPEHRGRGIGATLMNHARQIARDEMNLEQLHLAARSGIGLEDFYGRLGYTEIGRRRGAYRLTPEDDRDEILMALAPL